MQAMTHALDWIKTFWHLIKNGNVINTSSVRLQVAGNHTGVTAEKLSKAAVRPKDHAKESCMHIMVPSTTPIN